MLASGTRYYVIACGGKLYYSVVGSGTFTAYQIGGADLTFDSTVDVEMVQYLDDLWVVNGKYPVITNTGFTNVKMLRIHGTTVNEEQTGTADSGSTTTLVDSALTQVDDYWNGGVLAITGGTNSGEVRLISDFDAATDTVTVSVAFTNPIDATSVYAIYEQIGDANTPSGGELIIEHEERLFIAKSDDNGNGLYWTEPFEPEDWTPEYGLNYDFVGKDDGENITSIISYHGYVIVGKAHSMYRYSTVGDITEWGAKRADTTFGCLYHRTMKEFFGRLVYLSNVGVVAFDGNNAEILSDNIEDDMLELPQLKNNIRQWLQTTTTEFDTGTAGAKLVNTADDELKAIPQTSQADWDAGTKSQVNTDLSPGDVKLAQYNAGTNLALNQPASQNSDFPGYPAANGNDGNVNTYAINRTPSPYWWKVDLGSSKTIGYIYVKMRGNEGTPTILIQGSNNDIDWTTLETQVVDTTLTYYGYEQNAISYRYLRLYCTTTVFWTAEFEVYAPYYRSTGNIATQTLDFGFTPNSFGNLAAEITVPANTGITFQTRSSANGTSWDSWTNIGSAGENNGVINSTVRRYLQWKAILTTTDSGATPILHQGYVGVEYWSVEKDLGVTPDSWGKFDSAYVADGQTITWWMRSAATQGGLAAATWYQQTPGNIVSTVTLNQWVQYSVRINSVLYSGTPIVGSVQINYYTGPNLVAPCAAVWGDLYKLNVTAVGSSENDIVFQYNKEGYWLPKRTNKHNNIYFIDQDNLVSGTSESDGFVRLNEIGTQDDTTDIDSWFETKKFELVPMVKLLRRYLVSSKSDADWTLSYSLDDAAYVDVTIDLQSVVKTVNKVFAGVVRGRYVKFKIRQNSEDANWELHKLDVMWKPVRELDIDD